MPIVPTAIIAFISLALLDGFLIMVALLGDVDLQILLMASCLTTTLLAFVLKRAWLVYLAQSLVTGLLSFRFVLSLSSDNMQTSGNDFISFLTAVGIIVLGYFLAWLIARAVPMNDRS